MVHPALEAYFSRMKGQRYDPSKLKIPPKPPTRVAILLSSFVASFTGIAIVASLSFNAQWFLDRDVPVIAGSFGASAVLIYGAIEAPLSQPRNVIGGHIMSALIGVSLFKLFNMLSAAMFAKLHWLLCSLAVSLSLFLMQLTHTVHPPASATALIAVTGGPTIYNLGYWYVLCPIALGVALMMIVAMLVNNVARKYPVHWWNPKTRMVAVVDQDMSTTIADFLPADVGEDEDEDKECKEEGGKIKKGDAQPQAPALATGQELGTSSRSSITDSPSTINGLSVHNIALHTDATTVHSSPVLSSKNQSEHHHHHNHNQHQAQYAVYYGGHHNKEIKDGERMLEDPGSPSTFSTSSPKDLEHGRDPRHVSPSILIEKRGSPHPSHSAGPSIEEEYRAKIDRLQLRIRELEDQLAFVAK
ncbi:hypothetical protein BGX28_009121 [Mortierella sp. GBA30]|nr:hypothetical protein BGX28_009121 [Mortierella sp. GBA30]